MCVCVCGRGGGVISGSSRLITDRPQELTIGTATKTSVTKCVRAASNFMARFPSHSVRQMLENFSGVEF